MTKKYWEVEEAVQVAGTKSVAKFYVENGKIQVFPVVPNSPRGIGRGATLDLETMSRDELQRFQELVMMAVDEQLNKPVNQK